MTDELVSEPEKKKSVWPFVAVGVVLMAVGLGLALWKVTDDDEPDYEADCALIEEKVPDLGPALSEIFAGIEQGYSDGRDETLEGVDKANEVYRDMADDLTDRDFADELDAFADRSDKIADGMKEGNLNVAASELPKIMSFGNTAVSGWTSTARAGSAPASGASRAATPPVRPSCRRSPPTSPCRPTCRPCRRSCPACPRSCPAFRRSRACRPASPRSCRRSRSDRAYARQGMSFRGGSPRMASHLGHRRWEHVMRVRITRSIAAVGSGLLAATCLSGAALASSSA